MRPLPTPGPTGPAVTASRSRSVRTLTATVALSLAIAGLVLPSGASAAQAPEAPTSTFGPGDTVTGVAPDGTCAVVATVTGGAGGRSAAGADGAGANGAAASITATFAVTPGTAFSGSVGGGGRENTNATGGAGGVNGGGAGGTALTQHGGAGGGGYTSLYLGGTTQDDLVVLAGGGGGSGGGHSVTTDGFGGDAGLPATPGASAPGAAGTDGFEGGPVVGGGQGGTASAPGAGGAHETDPSLDGLPGVDSTGGAGAADPNYDAGGGGGGGLYGGGGGASTIIQNGDGGIDTVAGGGGGGGSSFVAGTAQGLTSVLTGDQTGTGAGADGSLVLDWVACDYDLAVTKSFAVDDAPTGSPDLAPVGSTITWTVTVVNNGPQAMTRGDTVTLADTLPGAGTTTLTAISATGGDNDTFERGPITCDTAVGAPMPTALECSREHALLGEGADGRRGLDVGETLTVTYTQEVTDPASTVLANTVTVDDRGDQDDNTDTATVTVVGPPVATDDVDLGNTIGAIVPVDVLDNDVPSGGALVPSSVVLWDPVADEPIGTELVVPGEGTWTVTPATGVVAFAPEAGFLVDPTPVTYRVTDENGLSSTATVTVAYVPRALDDSDLANAIGDTVTVEVLRNDEGDMDPTSVVLLDGGDRVTTLTAPGEGTWTVDPVSGAVTFAPEPGFTTDPAPVAYEVTDTTGDTVTATVTVGYVPDAVDDSDLRNTIGDVVTVDVIGNDVGDMVPGSVVLLAGADRVTTLTVPGEGTWTVDPVSGAVTFSPEAGFTLNPTPVDYEVTDSTGDTASARVTVTYLPVADDDSSRGNVLGEPVVVDVLPNDTGAFDASSLRLVDPATGQRVRSLTVPGQGVWTLDTVAGTVTFTPETGYYGNPTPVTYEVANTAGDLVEADVVITFLPAALDDVDEDNLRGTTVTVDVVGNDRGTLDPTSVRLVAADGTLVMTLAVPGEGTWTVDPTTGAITFAPLAGFAGDPTPVRYQVADVEGNVTAAEVRITYVDAPAAPPAQAVAGTPLATTGWDGMLAAGLAVLLVLAGALTLVARRRWILRG